MYEFNNLSIYMGDLGQVLLKMFRVFKHFALMLSQKCFLAKCAEYRIHSDLKAGRDCRVFVIV